MCVSVLLLLYICFTFARTQEFSTWITNDYYIMYAQTLFLKQARLNCEVLHDEYALEIRWSVVGSGETIVFQLVGRIGM